MFHCARMMHDADVREWLEKERLGDYASQVARYGGKLSQLMNRLSTSVIASFGCVFVGLSVIVARLRLARLTESRRLSVTFRSH